MNNRTLAIYDIEHSYADGLMQYISDKKNIPFRIICFTNKQSLFSYLEKHHIDILLISADAMEDKIKNQYIEKIILLSDGTIYTEYIGYDSIFKYQSSEKIIKEVLEYCVDICEDDQVVQVSKNKAEIIVVYSPVSRVGKTTFAITLGQVLSSDQSVLYINMEEFSPLGKMFKESKLGDLSDLMYFYKRNPDVLPIKLQAVVSNIHNLDYVPPMTFSEDLRNIDTQEWIEMITKIAENTSYEKIIVDVSNMVGNIFKILEISDLIYMVINDDHISSLKVASYEEYLLKREKEKILDKTIKVKLPKLRQSDDENIYEQQIWGDIGDYVRSVVNSAADKMENG